MRERKMQNEHDYAWICKNFGVQGAAASYPCVYCLVHSQDLQIPPHTSKIKDATSYIDNPNCILPGLWPK